MGTPHPLNHEFTPPPNLQVSSTLNRTADPLWGDTYVRQRDRSHGLFQCLSNMPQELEDNNDNGSERKDINFSEDLDPGKRKLDASSIRSKDITSTQKNKTIKLTEASSSGLTSGSSSLTLTLSDKNDPVSNRDPLQKKETRISLKGKVSRTKNLQSLAEDTDLLVPKSSPGDAEGNRGSSRYNLRTRPPTSKFRSNKQSNLDLCSNRAAKNNDELKTYSWNSEFPEAIIRADLRERRKKNVEAEVDISRRDTYWKSNIRPPPFTCPTLDNGNILVPTTLEAPLTYAQSLAKFTADLGPVAPRVAARKLESILPSSAHSMASEVGGMAQPIFDVREDPRAASSTTITRPLLIPAPSNSIARPTPTISSYPNFNGMHDFDTLRVGSGSRTIPKALTTDGLPPLPFNNVMRSMFARTELSSGSPIARVQTERPKNLFVSTELTLKTHSGGVSGSSSSRVEVDSLEDHQLNLDLNL